MCGISGFINLNNIKLPEINLDLMLEQQIHRGPDFQDKYYNQYVGFAHNRLSILDLSPNGNQPFQDENFILVYNGEIYNFLELKSELPTYEYTSTSDTAILFHALKIWGVNKTVKKIKGMFAFSWYNKNTQELYLVRDRLGIKPLFYSIDEQNTFWFASEVKSLLKVINGKPNPFRVLFSSLGSIERSRHETVWDNIKQIEPGTYLKISNEGIQKNTYYTIFETVNENRYRELENSSISDVVNEFEHLLNSSIKSMCASDASMGCFVSGGIDSSLISYYATQNISNLKLFTANILGKHSEFKDAKKLAKSLNKELFDYPFEKEMSLRDWTRVTWHYESPIVVHFNAIPFSNVAYLTREHQVKAVLTGEGADELFLGYPKLLMKRYENYIRFPYTVLNTLYSKIPRLKHLINQTGGSQDLLDVFKFGSQNFTKQLIGKESLKTYDFIQKDKREEHIETAKMLSEHLVSLLWRNDRMGMMHSVESRFPFLDENLISFGMNLPTKFKIGKTSKLYNVKHPFLIDKFIIRKLAEKSLPNQLVYKRKNGFPLHSLRDIIVNPKFFYNGTIIEIMQLSKEQLHYMCSNYWNYLISILASVEIWCKLFIENKNIEEIDELVLKYIKFK